MTMTIDQMSARYVDPKMKEAAAKIPSRIVSADDHVFEPHDLFKSLPQHIRDRAVNPPLETANRPKGGLDPKLRVPDMDLDGITAAVLYPTYVLRQFAAEQDVQEACFRAYNDWIADYCKNAPKRLFSIPCLSVYDVKGAIKEMQRCHDLGLLGGMIWQVPDPKLPLTSTHYDPLWAAAAEMGFPIHLHILTGHNYKRHEAKGMEKIRGSVNIKTNDAVTSIYDLIWSGVFSRHPKLKVVMVEAEIGWMPFMLQQWDYYYKRNTKPGHPNEDFLIDRLPSEIFKDHVWATFMDDVVGAHMLKVWGADNCMWSSDYPHGNMTWPNSRAFLGRMIGDLPLETQKRLVCDNVVELYRLQDRL